MLSKYQVDYLNSRREAADQAGHIYPMMAACEAALESGYGTSALSIQDHNEFGMKQHQHPIFGTHNLPTKEFENGEWVVVNAAWVHYPDFAACFQDRMATLQRLSSVYPHYKAALDAQTMLDYVTQVSLTWSTDPQRGQKVLDIYKAYQDA